MRQATGLRRTLWMVAALAPAVVLTACEPAPPASPLATGYVYRDFPIANIVRTDPGLYLDGRALVFVPLGEGKTVYLQLFCGGALVASDHGTISVLTPSITAAVIWVHSLDNDCFLREHVPKRWKPPRVEISRELGPGGGVVSSGTLFYH